MHAKPPLQALVHSLTLNPPRHAASSGQSKRTLLKQQMSLVPPELEVFELVAPLLLLELDDAELDELLLEVDELAPLELEAPPLLVVLPL